MASSVDYEPKDLGSGSWHRAPSVACRSFGSFFGGGTAARADHDGAGRAALSWAKLITNQGQREVSSLGRVAGRIPARVSPQ